MRVLQAGRRFYQRGIVRQVRKDGDTAYEKIDFFHAHKQEILRFSADPKKLAELPTKRRPQIASLPQKVFVPTASAKVKRLTIDDVYSFAAVKRKEPKGNHPPDLSENEFKRGVQAIIGEGGEFKDWGGERSDLYSTRLLLKKAKRVTAAFGFKGPGQPGKLVIGRMGKNGDQLPRLFQEEADVFFVQHWREIDLSVLDLMRNLAVAKSVTTGKQICYGVIDGHDSERLMREYPAKFGR